MGFWSNFWGSFFGHAAAETQKNNAQKEKENIEWNNTYNELSRHEEEFNSFLKSIGSPAFYNFDVNCIDEKRVDREIEKIDRLKKQVNQYLSIGGNGSFILNISMLDDYILKVELLKKHNALDRQIEFAGKNYLQTKNILESEKLDIASISKKIDLFSSYENSTSYLISDDELENIIDEYYFDAYQYYKNEKDHNPVRSECGIVSVLTYAVGSRLFTLFDSSELLTIEELNKLTDLIESHLDCLISNPSLNSKKGRYIYYYSLLLASEVCFWHGKLARSIIYLAKVLNEWNEAKEESFGFTTEVAASIFSLLNIMGLSEYVDLFYEENKAMLESEKAQYKHFLETDSKNSSASMASFYKTQLLKIEDRHNTYSFISLSPVDILDFTRTQMYDTGLEFNLIDVRCGFSRIYIDREQDSLALYLLESRDSKKIEGMTIINNLSSVIEREKHELLALFSK